MTTVLSVNFIGNLHTFIAILLVMYKQDDCLTYKFSR